MFIKKAAVLSAAVGMMAFAAMPASAGVVLSSVDGNAVYAGPTPTYDFETPAPVVGGTITTGSLNGIRAQPLGSTGNYLSAGPGNGGSAIMDLSSFIGIASISLLWGSIDDYNFLDLLDSGGNVFGTYDGLDVFATANGNQTLPQQNRIVTLTFSGIDQGKIKGLQFRSNQNAFEIDNVAVQAVPEPAAWMTMILGFGLIGGMARRRRRSMVAATA